MRAHGSERRVHKVGQGLAGLFALFVLPPLFDVRAHAEPLANPAEHLFNPGFEAGSYAPGARPVGWSPRTWQLSEASFLWDDTSAMTGGKSVAIKLSTPGDASWTQDAAVSPHTGYLLSGWIKTEDVRKGAGASLSLAGTSTRSPGLFGDRAWTWTSVVFQTGEEAQVTVAARLGEGGAMTAGAAWFDDLRLVPVAIGQIRNGGFEAGTGDQPEAWSPEMVGGAASLRWDAMTAHRGGRSARISASGLSVARWAEDVPVEADSEYELSGWIKTMDVQAPADPGWTGGATIGAVGIGSALAASTEAIQGTTDWTYVSTRFVTGGATTARIVCSLGEAGARGARSYSAGAMWCDDLALVKARR